MLNTLLLNALVAFLPPGFNWGDPLTPEVLHAILEAHRAVREGAAR